MAALFNLVGTVVKTTAIATGITLAVAAAFAYVTKPTEKMLIEEIKSRLTSDSNGLVETVTIGVVSIAATKTSKISIKDYVVVKLADVTFINGKRRQFVGAFQQWFPIR